MRIVLTTFDRKPSYLDQTLRSFFACSPIGLQLDVLVSERTPDCLGTWLTHPNVHAHTFTQEQQVQLTQLLNGARTQICTRLALELGAGETVVLQDDLEFVPGWFNQLETAVRALGADRDTSLLALYSPHHHSKAPVDHYPPHNFFGMQAMFFGRTARTEAIRWLTMRHEPGLADDVILQRMLLSNPTYHLYAMVPSVVQHIGLESPIGSTRAHQSPTFGWHALKEKG